MHRTSTQIILSALLINPITLWMLTGSFFLSVGISVLVAVISILLFRKTQLVRLKVWWVNILAILSICYHSELVFIVLFPELDVPNLYEIKGAYYFNKPGLEQKFENEEFVSHYKTNAQGLRIPLSIDATRPVHSCDWLFVGDSFTQGAQVEYEEMFSSLLAKRFPAKVVVNAGISGAGIPEIYHYLSSEGMLLHPKHVFLQLGVFNDFCNVREHQASVADWILEKSHLFRYITHSLSSRFDLPIGRWCEPFRPNRQENIDYNILFKETSPVKDADKENLSLYIDKIKALCSQNGAELTIILIPSKEQTSLQSLAEVMAAYRITEDELDMTYPNEWMAALSKEKGIEVVDMLQPFRLSSASPFFEIDEHLTSIGHRIVANGLYEHLTKGSACYKLISDGWQNERYPSMLSDGATVLFQCSDAYGNYYIRSTDTTFNFQSSLVTSCEELVHPTISANGRFLAFTTGCQENARTKVCLDDLVLGSRTVITPETIFGAIPAFSRDSRHIALPVWNEADVQEPRIAVYDIESGKISSYITDGKRECWRPIFSNDGKSLYFIEKGKRFAIKRYSFVERVVSDVLTTSYDIWDIALSPSGNTIAYAGNPDGNWDLFVYNIATGENHRLTKTSANEWDPSFGSHDNDLFFAVESGFFDGICRMKIAP